MEKLYSHKFLCQLFLLITLQFSFCMLLSSAYTLPDKYFINCGSDSNITTSGNRNFVGDRKASYLGIFPGQSTPVKDKNPSTDTSQLYQTARLYKQPSSYELTINQNGTYLVRLHFFVFSSPTNLVNALFNISASGFSLLSNFSVQNVSRSPIIKEFLLTINVTRFRIDFIPYNASTLAFINAIEVFPAPESFIPQSADRITPGGHDGNFGRLLSQALHTVHRINVGGPTLTPENDTMWRDWIPDDSYLSNKEAAKKSQPFPDRPKFELGGATQYIAPDLVYKTAKELNVDSNRQSNFFNITWRFEVSKNSRHFVRVHFCDIISPTLDVLVFNLYIYSKFSWIINPYEKIGQLAAPFYLDYVVDSDDSGYLNISVGPRHDSQKQTAFLNGLEIMEFVKKSDLVLMPGKEKKNKMSVILGSVGAGAAAIILIVVVFLRLNCRKTKPDQTIAGYRRGSSGKTADGPSASDLNLELRISYTEIQRATRNFNAKSLIGEGGFGKVYKGELRGNKVAVKRCVEGHGQGLEEFHTEITVLSIIRHRHLVSLIGFCDERSEMILVYEYMEKGTLRSHLYDSNEISSTSGAKLSWKQRLEICIGSAQGLHYLHTGSTHRIIHRDVKSTNILLDENYEAKVADFGLSKSGPPDPENISMAVKGTLGYLDPEYFMCLQLTEKSDVYSFGVVLLEVLCARPAIIHNPEQRKEVNLVEWVRSNKDQLEEIIDPVLVGEVNSKSLRIFLETAEKCLKENGAERPTMRDVLYDLEYASGLQQPAVVPREPYDDSTINIDFSLPVSQQLPSNSFPVQVDNFAIENDDDLDITAGEVFSKLKFDDIDRWITSSACSR